jgi:hypothetical protein
VTSAIFTATGLYQTVASLSSDAYELVTPVPDDRRTAVTLLRKRLDGFYAQSQRPKV